MQTPKQIAQWREEAQKLWNEQGRAHWVNIGDFDNYAAGYLQARTDQANEQYIKAIRSITLVNDREPDVRPVPSLIEQPLITAEEARKLGVGKAECFTSIFGWDIIGHQHIYRYENKYRAIKQPEPVEPTCQVRNLDTGGLKTMTREAAKLLQAELGDTVEWLDPIGCNWSYPLEFKGKGIYTYKLKGTVKLTIDNEPAKMLTPAECEAERLARVDTHDLQFIFDDETWEKVRLEKPVYWSVNLKYEYRLVRKPLKQVSWKDVPAGVAVRDKKTNVVWLHQGAGDDTQALVTAPQNMPFGMRWIDLGDFELAPASEQTWIAVQDDRSIIGLFRELDKAGLAYEFDAMRYRITGLAEGWVPK